MSTDRTALDWTRPIQFANGEPLELMDTLADRLNMHVVNRPPTPDATVDEDGWWEMVFVEKEAIQDDCGCGRGECFTFACECRRIAIENVSRDTGVCFATEE